MPSEKKSEDHLKRSQALKLYLAGVLKDKEISKEIGIKLTTFLSWKRRGNWKVLKDMGAIKLEGIIELTGTRLDEFQMWIDLALEGATEKGVEVRDQKLYYEMYADAVEQYNKWLLIGDQGV